MNWGELGSDWGEWGVTEGEMGVIGSKLGLIEARCRVNRGESYRQENNWGELEVNWRGIGEVLERYWGEYGSKLGVNWE